MTTAEIAPKAMTDTALLAEIDRLTAEIARLQIRLGEERERNEDLTFLRDAARAQVSAEQRSHLAYRLRNPSRPKTPQPTARPVHDIGEGAL